MANIARTDTAGKFKVRVSIGPRHDRHNHTQIIHATTRTIDRLAADFELLIRNEHAEGICSKGKATPTSTSDEPTRAPIVDTHESDPTFAVMCRRYIDARSTARHWSDSHHRAQEAQLVEIDDSKLGDVRMSKLKEHHLTEHLAALASTPTWCGKERGVASVSTRCKLLRAVVRYAIADPDVLVRGNPADDLAVQEGTTVAERDIPTVSELLGTVRQAASKWEREIAADAERRVACVEGDGGYRGRPGHRLRGELSGDFAEYALLSGMRRSEICALQAWDVEHQADGFAVVQVRRSLVARTGAVKRTKTGKSRTILVSPPAAAILLRRQTENETRALADGIEPLRRGFVFSTGWGETPLKPDRVTKWWDRLRTLDARLAGLRLHDLRHAHGSELHAKGWHTAAIAAHMGHSIEVSNRLYNHKRPTSGVDLDMATAMHAAAASI